MKRITLYVVPPLEGFWWQEGVWYRLAHNENFSFVSLIRLPDFVTKADFNWAIAEATKKKKTDFSKVEFFTFNEGLCVQCMHIGSYDDEPATIAMMHEYAEQNGYELDISDSQYHHEIYLSDSRKCEPTKLRTVVRHPIRKVREMRKEKTQDEAKRPIWKSTLKWIGIAVATLILAAGLFICVVRSITWFSNRIDTANGIDEGIYVSLGGQEQYLLIRGADTSNPVMIWLHGGPSSPDAFANYTFQKHLVGEYTVVNWDQRGCGRTYYRNKDTDPNNKTTSFEQAQADLDELVDYLREMLNEFMK